MEQKLIIAFNHFDTGGLQTLMVRMAQWGNSKGLNPILIYKTCDSNMNNICKEKHIRTMKGFQKKEIKKLLNETATSGSEVILISFEIDDFIFLEEIRRDCFFYMNIKHIMYNVSVGSTIFSKNIYGFIGNISFDIYRKIVSRYYMNEQLIFMDSDTIEAYSEYYGVEIVDTSTEIFLLPMFIDKAPDFIEERSFKSKQILTVTRASFPFKGYVMGLLDEFSRLVKEIGDVSLKIVSFGEDYDKLIKKINELPDDIRDRIYIINGMSIEMIKKELQQTHVYVGMGTTVLDAASQAIPSIVAIHSSMKSECVGFFHDKPEVLGQGGSGHPIEDLIIKIFKMSKEEYFICRNETYEAYKKNYNIDYFMSKLIKRCNSIHGETITRRELIFHHLMCVLRRMKRRVLG